MKARHLLSIAQMTRDELAQILDRAGQLKSEYRKGKPFQPLIGKTLGLLFSKSSTRTRISFEAAMAQLGGTAIFLPTHDLQLNRGETTEDTARILSHYLSALVIRTFAHQEIERWAAAATIPIINGLTDLHHPCQVLGDLFTLKERFGSLKGLVLAYIGDGNNVAHSLMEGAAHTGMIFRVACPEGYSPKNPIVRVARQVAVSTGAQIEIMKDPKKAAQGADILYTDVWVSMGQERDTKKREKVFKPYQVNDALLRVAKPTACVMHCLPAYRGKEITAAVLDGPKSIVWEQAENRLHTQKAVLEWLLL